MEEIQEPKQDIHTVQEQQVKEKLHSAEANVAQLITNFAGSMMFAYLHAFWFVMWIIINHGLLLPFIPIFDPFPYGLLTMIVSLEAIFLSTFIMVAQNRQALVDTYRDIEEDKEQAEDDKEQEELEEDVQGLEQEVKELGKEVDDIQKDLDDIIKGITTIQQKLSSVEVNKASLLQSLEKEATEEKKS